MASPAPLVSGTEWPPGTAEPLEGQGSSSLSFILLGGVPPQGVLERNDGVVALSPFTRMELACALPSLPDLCEPASPSRAINIGIQILCSYSIETGL